MDHENLPLIIGLALGFLTISKDWLAGFVVLSTTLLAYKRELVESVPILKFSWVENMEHKDIISIGLGLGLFLVVIGSTTNDQNIELANTNSVQEREYRQLENRYSSLSDDYDNLLTRYRGLRNKSRYAIYPPYISVENRTFTVAFRGLDGSVNTWWWQGYFQDQFLTGVVMRQYSVSQLEYLGEDRILDRFKDDTKYRRLGDFGSYYQYDAFVEPGPFEDLSEDIYEKYETDEKRVREVWNYATQETTYNKDIGETPRMPMETLLLGGGDCEDSAILVASMLEAMPEEWDTEFVYMDAENPSSPQDINHVGIYVDTGEYSTFIETTSNSSLTGGYRTSQIQGFRTPA